MHMAKKVETKVRVQWTDLEREKIYAEMHRRKIDPTLLTTQFLKEERGVVASLKIRERRLWPPEAKKERAKYLEYIRNFELEQRRTKLDLVVSEGQVIAFNAKGSVKSNSSKRTVPVPVKSQVMTYIDLVDELVVPVITSKKTEPAIREVVEPVLSPQIVEQLRVELDKHKSETMALLMGMYDGIMTYFDKDYKRVAYETVRYVGEVEGDQEKAQEFVKTLQEKRLVRRRVLYASNNYRRVMHLQNDFEGIDFEFVNCNNQNILDSLITKDFDLVIGTRWMSHEAARKLSDQFKEKYVVSHGACSDVKRIIQEKFCQ